MQCHANLCYFGAPSLAVGRHCALPNTRPGEGAGQVVWFILANQKTLCPLLLALTLTLMFALPSSPPPAPLCLARTHL